MPQASALPRKAGGGEDGHGAVWPERTGRRWRTGRGQEGGRLVASGNARYHGSVGAMRDRKTPSRSGVLIPRFLRATGADYGCVEGDIVGAHFRGLCS